MVDMAIANCDRLVRLVNDILDFDKVEKGRLPLHRVPVEAVRTCCAAPPTLPMRPHRTMPHHVPHRSRARAGLADEDRILQVLNELVANAIKFSPPHTIIRLSAQPPGRLQGVVFAVEDQGHGIPPEKLEHIFESLSAGRCRDTRALGGTGLGLALCRSIVEQHGGRIWAERSRPGQPVSVHASRRSNASITFPAGASGSLRPLRSAPFQEITRTFPLTTIAASCPFTPA